ncbi:hypothetical protein [uncultured Microbacterium sp.]|uniref:hypothetical protein n=1 Tax=uncultured Microbacterium sp. TaxID=191216 RepID=UPI0028E1EAB3|nr:hypothetical protein [uncultured Microbacterium sp.]
MNQFAAKNVWHNPLVLENRPIRADVDHASLSRFADNTWDLTPAVFEEHSTKVSINFLTFEARWRDAIKSYLWSLINDDEVRAVPGAIPEARPSVRSISLIKSSLTRLFSKLDSLGVTDLQQLDAQRLEDLAIDLGSTSTFAQGRKVLTEVRRLWSYRSVVPRPLKMLPGVPWNGDRATDLLPAPPMRAENKTARIADSTLLPLMAWSIRFVEDFSEDILASFREYQRLIVLEYRHRPGEEPVSEAASRGNSSRENLAEVLRTLKRMGRGLPGRVLVDGSREVQLNHLGRLAHSNPQWLKKNHFDLLAEFNLPIDDDAYITVPCSGRLDGAVWRREPLPWAEIPVFATRLQTACFIVIGYLSGMRPGEVLSLTRDCLSHDAETGIWTVTGTRWKAVRDDQGEKRPQGESRETPWVVHPVAARAIQTLRELHHGELLFPAKLRPQPLRGIRPPENLRSGKARTSSQLGTDIIEFTAWVNRYVEHTGRIDLIPDDPRGRVNPRRLRRTLAWHIVRRPRGLVAAAIQYGHVATYITQGYAGNYASGFPDDLAFERWLARFEELSELDRYASAGGRVSGPAADELVDRASSAKAKFAGRVLPTHRQAASLLNDPLLQVYPGDGMHCVFNSETALCARDAPKPLMSSCQSACSNIARTDADVETLRLNVQRLRDDTLAPPIRHARTLELISRIDHTIENHHSGSETP